MNFDSNPVLPSPEGSQKMVDRMPGKVVFPSHPAYDAARAAWNTAVDQRPALVVFAENVLDIIEAVTYARSNGLPLAVQSTGHGVIRKADGAVLVNTSRMQSLWIDPEARTAWVEAGVKWGTVLQQAQVYGLAPLLGSSPDVGAVGYTLGGGMGWLCRKYGLSADSVLRLEVVTPDGILRRASRDEHPDLFWALRGGGGGFGVVTGMEIRLHPVTQVYAGSLLYPAELAGEVIERFERWVTHAPDELTAGVALMNFPPIPQVPEPLRGKSHAIVRGCYAGPMEEGEQMLRYWRMWRPSLADEFRAMPFAQVASISQDPPDPMPFRMTGGWLRDLSSQTAEALINYTLPQGPLPQGEPPVLAVSEVRLAGGAIARVNPDACAYSHRGERFIWSSIATVLTPEMDQNAAAHLDQMRGALGDRLTGRVYMNFLAGDEASQRAREGYSEDALRRLREIKAFYDPDYRLSYGYDLRGEKPR